MLSQQHEGHVRISVGPYALVFVLFGGLSCNLIQQVLFSIYLPRVAYVPQEIQRHRLYLEGLQQI